MAGIEINGVFQLRPSSNGCLTRSGPKADERSEQGSGKVLQPANQWFQWVDQQAKLHVASFASELCGKPVLHTIWRAPSGRRARCTGRRDLP